MQWVAFHFFLNNHIGRDIQCSWKRCHFTKFSAYIKQTEQLRRMLKLLKLGEELPNALLRPGTVDGGQPSFLRKKCDSKKNKYAGNKSYKIYSRTQSYVITIKVRLFTYLQCEDECSLCSLISEVIWERKEQTDWILQWKDNLVMWCDDSTVPLFQSGGRIR